MLARIRRHGSDDRGASHWIVLVGPRKLRPHEPGIDAAMLVAGKALHR